MFSKWKWTRENFDTNTGLDFRTKERLIWDWFEKNIFIIMVAKDLMYFK
jgi:hypothetical protein